MPKQRITREMLLEAAMALLEEEGPGGVTVQAIARRTGCSVQPVYTCLGSMEGMWQAVGEEAAARVHELVLERTDPGDLFRSTGLAFAAVAQEHPHLFQMFAACKRRGVRSLDGLLALESGPEVARGIEEKFGLPPETARAFHLNMLIYNVGLCAICASCAPDLPAADVFGRLEDAAQAFLAQARREESLCNASSSTTAAPASPPGMHSSSQRRSEDAPSP